MACPTSMSGPDGRLMLEIDSAPWMHRDSSHVTVERTVAGSSPAGGALVSRSRCPLVEPLARPHCFDVVWPGTRSVAQLSGDDGSLHPGLHVEFRQDVRHVCLDRGLADEQRPRDICVRLSVTDALEHLAFSVGEQVQGGMPRHRAL